jgi:GNAT superfamily N-acetyltransferase
MPLKPIIRPISAEETFPLRHSVLWPDKPPSYVQLPDDATGQHFGAFINDKVVSVISLFIDSETNEARFRKFATAPEWQGKGIGSALLRHTIDAATRDGAKAIWCDSRRSAEAFYGKFGFEVEGDEFFKGEIPYVKLRKVL